MPVRDLKVTIALTQIATETVLCFMGTTQLKITIIVLWEIVAHKLGYASVRPFLHFDRFSSARLLRTLYLELRTFLQILTYYWSRSTGRSKV